MADTGLPTIESQVRVTYDAKSDSLSVRVMHQTQYGERTVGKTFDMEIDGDLQGRLKNVLDAVLKSASSQRYVMETYSAAFQAMEVARRMGEDF